MKERRSGIARVGFANPKRDQGCFYIVKVSAAVVILLVLEVGEVVTGLAAVDPEKFKRNFGHGGIVGGEDILLFVGRCHP